MIPRQYLAPWMALALLLSSPGLLAPHTTSAHAETQNVLKYGDFDDPTGFGEGMDVWLLHNAASIQTEANGNRFLRLVKTENRLARAEVKVKVQPGWQNLRLSGRMRGEGLVNGEQNWQAARLVGIFMFADQPDRRGYVDVPTLRADSGWVTLSTTFKVPEGATSFEVHPGIYGKDGTMDVDDIQLIPNPGLEHAVYTPGFPEGTFETLINGQPAGWPGLNTGVSIEKHEDGSGQFLRLDSTQVDFTPEMSMLVKVEKNWASVKVSARIRTRQLQLGSESHHTPRVQLTFVDEAGDRVGGWPPVPSSTDGSGAWVTKQVELMIPQGAAFLQVRPAMFGCEGIVDIDDIKIEPEIAGALPGAEAPMWGQEPVVALSPVRGRVVLNGLWRFAPAVADNEDQPKDESWGWIRVPGSWTAQYDLPGVVTRGLGEAWRGLNVRELAKAWYEREMDVPAEWSGRRMLLEFSRVSTDARVYVNDKFCGEVHWPSGTVDVTKAVTPGETATLRMLVVAVRDDEMIDRVMGPNQVTQVKARLLSRGITNDVMLTSQPMGGVVKDVFLETSVRNKQLGVELELDGVADGSRLNLQAVTLGEDGTVEQTFAGRVIAKEGRAKVTWDWANPRLWDLDQPNLYDMRLAVKGPGIDDVFPRRFGFREFRVEGRRFLLNEKEIRLRPYKIPDDRWGGLQGQRAHIRTMIRAYRNMGYNILEQWPWNGDDRGVMAYREHWLEIADEEGMLMMAGGLPSAHALMGYNQNSPWLQPGAPEAFSQRLEIHMRPLRRHPSNVMWAFTANSFGHIEDQNPRLIGMKRDHKLWQDPFFPKSWHNRMSRGDQAVQKVKDLDPTRPVLVHQGGPIGDVYALNSYLCFIPLQEREEWLSHWTQHGEMPYMIVEFGTPLDCSYMRGTAGGGWGAGRPGGAMTSEPLLSEYAAIYFGREAYAMEQKAYRDATVARLKPDQPDDPNFHGQVYAGWQHEVALMFAPASQKIQELFIPNTYRSWRAMGITGGMLPWSDAIGFDWFSDNRRAARIRNEAFVPGTRGIWDTNVRRIHATDRFADPETSTVMPSGHAIREALRPTMAYIGGNPDRFTEKSHLFRAGQDVTKQAILLNDSRHPRDYAFTMSVAVDGQPVFTQDFTGSIDPAQTLKLPFTFKAPTTSAITSGTITMTGTIGKAEHDDRFPLTVFPAAENLRASVLVFDPEGTTTDWLKSIGLSTRDWDGQASGQLLVVGREALSNEHTPPGDLQAFVKQGGRMLVMAQHPDWLEEVAAFRVAPVPSRRVFAVSADHPVTQGFNDDWMRDWTGAPTLTDPKPNYVTHDVERSTAYGRFPIHGWRWGNQGAITSGAIEKPHNTGWRAILECEFDLAYSPLMENDLGKGRIILNMLDLEEQGPLDPAADLLGRRIVAYAANTPATPDAAVVRYLGGNKHRALLNQLGVVFEDIDRTPDDGEGLLIVSPDASIDPAALDSFAQAGGKVLVLATPTGQPLLGATYTKSDNALGSVNVPDWNQTQGLSPSDLRYRIERESWLLAESAGLEIGADGLLARRMVGDGVILFSQLDPERFDADRLTYHRYTRWRQTRAIGQLLANLGASFEHDGTLFRQRLVLPDDMPLPTQWRGRLTVPLPDRTEGFHQDPGLSAAARQAVSPSYDDSNWQRVSLPTAWEDWGGVWTVADGEGVFRVRFDANAELLGRDDVLLSLGTIDDFDSAYLNGRAIGKTDITVDKFWQHDRYYPVPKGLLKAQDNVLVVRVFDHRGGGGFTGGPSDLKLTVDVPPMPNLYHPDFRTDTKLGDDPYRYCRW